MRWLLSFLLLGLLSIVQALSSRGNKLLVILEDLAEKSKYSKYLADLEGMFCNSSFLSCELVLICFTIGRGFQIIFDSPKSENLGLFHLGQRAYDHLLVLPLHLKGKKSADAVRKTPNLN